MKSEDVSMFKLKQDKLGIKAFVTFFAHLPP